MTTIQFNCPHCDAHFRVKAEFGGRTGRCPKCSEPVRIPEAAAQDDPERTTHASVKPLSSTPYALKSDQLGMTLSDFKRLHHQDVPGHDQPLPWCSDATPGEKIEPLMSEPYFAAKGLVNCRLNFPFQEIRGEPAPTIAEVETELLLYKFVDEKLFEILALFPTDGFSAIYNALVAKHGPPHENDGEQIGWSNGVSTILLVKGKRMNQWTTEPSLLRLVHDKLCELTESRQPGPAMHDI